MGMYDIVMDRLRPIPNFLTTQQVDPSVLQNPLAGMFGQQQTPPAPPAAAPPARAPAPAGPPTRPPAMTAPAAAPRPSPAARSRAKPKGAGKKPPSVQAIKKEIDPELVPAVEAEALKEEAAELEAAGKPEAAQSKLDQAAEAYRRALSAIPADDPKRDALMALAQFGADLAATDNPDFLGAVGQAAGPGLASYEQARAAAAQRSLDRARGMYNVEKDVAEFAQQQQINEAKLAEMAAEGLLTAEQLEAARFTNKTAPQVLAAELAARSAQTAAAYANANQSNASAALDNARRQWGPTGAAGDGGLPTGLGGYITGLRAEAVKYEALASDISARAQTVNMEVNGKVQAVPAPEYYRAMARDARAKLADAEARLGLSTRPVGLTPPPARSAPGSTPPPAGGNAGGWGAVKVGG